MHKELSAPSREVHLLLLKDPLPDGAVGVYLRPLHCVEELQGLLALGPRIKGLLALSSHHVDIIALDHGGQVYPRGCTRLRLWRRCASPRPPRRGPPSCASWASGGPTSLSRSSSPSLRTPPTRPQGG